MVEPQSSTAAGNAVRVVGKRRVKPREALNCLWQQLAVKELERHFLVIYCIPLPKVTHAPHYVSSCNSFPSTITVFIVPTNAEVGCSRALRRRDQSQGVRVHRVKINMGCSELLLTACYHK